MVQSSHLVEWNQPCETSDNDWGSIPHHNVQFIFFFSISCAYFHLADEDPWPECFIFCLPIINDTDGRLWELWNTYLKCLLSDLIESPHPTHPTPQTTYHTASPTIIAILVPSEVEAFLPTAIPSYLSRWFFFRSKLYSLYSNVHTSFLSTRWAHEVARCM